MKNESRDPESGKNCSGERGKAGVPRHHLRVILHADEDAGCEYANEGQGLGGGGQVLTCVCVSVCLAWLLQAVMAQPGREPS